jgi:hypothetical protein
MSPMKQSDEAAIGGARKTLPVGKARKVRSAQKGSGKKPAARKKNILDRDVEAELVRVFGQK